MSCITSVSLNLIISKDTFSHARESITYKYTITNTGTAVINYPICIKDTKLGNLKFPKGKIRPGDAKTLSVRYLTTDCDLQNNIIHNKAIAFIQINCKQCICTNKVTGTVKYRFAFLTPNNTVNVVGVTSASTTPVITDIVEILANPNSQFTVNPPSFFVTHIRGSQFVLQTTISFVYNSGTMPNQIVVAVTSRGITKYLIINIVPPTYSPVYIFLSGTVITCNSNSPQCSLSTSAISRPKLSAPTGGVIVGTISATGQLGASSYTYTTSSAGFYIQGNILYATVVAPAQVCITATATNGAKYSQCFNITVIDNDPLLTGIWLNNGTEDNSQENPSGVIGVVTPLYATGITPITTLEYVVSDPINFTIDSNLNLIYTDNTGSLPETITITAGGVVQPITISPVEFIVGVITVPVLEYTPNALVATIEGSLFTQATITVTGNVDLIIIPPTDGNEGQVQLSGSVSYGNPPNVTFTLIATQGINVYTRDFITPVQQTYARPLNAYFNLPAQVAIGQLVVNNKTFPAFNYLPLLYLLRIITLVYANGVTGNYLPFTTLIPTDPNTPGYLPDVNAIEYTVSGEYLLSLDLYSGTELVLSGILVTVQVLDISQVNATNRLKFNIKPQPLIGQQINSITSTIPISASGFSSFQGGIPLNILLGTSNSVGQYPTAIVTPNRLYKSVLVAVGNLDLSTLISIPIVTINGLPVLSDEKLVAQEDPTVTATVQYVTTEETISSSVTSPITPATTTVMTYPNAELYNITGAITTTLTNRNYLTIDISGYLQFPVYTTVTTVATNIIADSVSIAIIFLGLGGIAWVDDPYIRTDVTSPPLYKLVPVGLQLFQIMNYNVPSVVQVYYTNQPTLFPSSVMQYSLFQFKIFTDIVPASIIEDNNIPALSGWLAGGLLALEGLTPNTSLSDVPANLPLLPVALLYASCATVNFLYAFGFSPSDNCADYIYNLGTLYGSVEALTLDFINAIAEDPSLAAVMISFVENLMYPALRADVYMNISTGTPQLIGVVGPGGFIPTDQYTYIKFSQTGFVDFELLGGDPIAYSSPPSTFRNLGDWFGFYYGSNVYLPPISYFASNSTGGFYGYVKLPNTGSSSGVNYSIPNQGNNFYLVSQTDDPALIIGETGAIVGAVVVAVGVSNTFYDQLIATAVELGADSLDLL